MQHIASKRLRDVDYPAELLGASRHRVWEMCRLGIIPHVRLGRRYKFDPEKLERWLEAGGSGLGDDRLSATKRKRAVSDTPSAKEKSTGRHAGREVL